jgi:hypothetical protein
MLTGIDRPVGWAFQIYATYVERPHSVLGERSGIGVKEKTDELFRYFCVRQVLS